MELKKINIRGVSFANVTMAQARQFIKTRIEQNDVTVVYTPNSEIVQLCIEQPEYYSIINSAELIVPDGVGVIKAAKILGMPLQEKVAGVELGTEVLGLAAENGYPVFLFGGKDASRCECGKSVADQCAEKFAKEYPGIQIAGTRDGYCKKEGADNEETLQQINESGATILFVCLGAPAQEKWIYENRHRLPNIKVFLGLGGSLDVYSGNVKRAPKFFIKLGLEWFYRLICEPWRIGRMMSLPRFYFGTWMYKLKGKKASSGSEADQ